MIRPLRALYRVLLFLCPPGFRRRFGWQMEGDFDEILAEARQRGWLRGARPVAVAFADVLRTAVTAWLHRPAERLRPARRGMADVVSQDLRSALRQLGRQKVLTVTLTLTLALGLGTSAAIFSVLNTVVLRPLPFPAPHDLFRIVEVSPQGSDYTTSEPMLLDWQSRARGFSQVGAYTFSSAIIQGSDEPEAVDGGRVTANLLPLLGLRPLLGRSFRSDEDHADAPQRVVILGEGFWARRFGSDPTVLGRTISMDGAPTVVVGVADLSQVRLLDYVEHLEFLVPLRADPANSRNMHAITALGRLAPGVTRSRAQADLDGLAAAVGRAHPGSNEGWGARIIPAQEWIVSNEVRTALAGLSGAVAFLLLLACANVSNLLVAKATTRVRELGVRTALGASRGALLRQLMTESLLLAALGSVAGLAVTFGIVHMVRVFGPSDVPRLAAVDVDGPVLLFTLGAAVVTCLVFGSVPAWHGARAGAHSALKRDGGGGRTGTRIRDALVVGELALAMVILVGVGLTGRSFQKLLRADPGFAADGLYSVRLKQPPGAGASDPATAFAALERQVSQLPGVTAAGLTFVEPLGGGSTSNRVAPEAWHAASQEEYLGVDWRAVTPGFFATMGLTPRAGRLLDDGPATPSDSTAGVPVVIDETLAARAWPDEDPVGRTLLWSRPGGQRLSVVGVVKSVRDVRMDRPLRGTVYLPHAARPWSTMTLMVRLHGDPRTTLPALRRTLRAAEPGMPVPAIHAVAENLGHGTAMPRFILQLFGLFGSVALVLAVTGVYGVMSNHVARRTREIGLRTAVGARSRDILGMVLTRVVWRTLAGLTLGVVGAFAASRGIGSVLYEVEPTDPLAYIAAMAVLAAAAVAAAASPARQAVSVDPMVALDAE